MKGKAFPALFDKLGSGRKVVGQLPDGRNIYEEIVSGTVSNYTDNGSRRQFSFNLKYQSGISTWVIDAKGYVYQVNGNRGNTTLIIGTDGAHQSPNQYAVQPEYASSMLASNGCVIFTSTTASGLTSIKYWAIIQYYEGTMLP